MRPTQSPLSMNKLPGLPCIHMHISALWTVCTPNWLVALELPPYPPRLRADIVQYFLIILHLFNGHGSYLYKEVPISVLVEVPKPLTAQSQGLQGLRGLKGPKPSSDDIIVRKSY
jgi:hypothetical protein